MGYVYIQKPMPTNATGVTVNLDVIDANNNFRNIGTTTDVTGTFSYVWQPDIPGKYTLIASFPGSDSYWSSSTETAFGITTPTSTATPTSLPIVSTTETYFVPAVIGIIIAVAIVGALLALLLLRKRS